MILDQKNLALGENWINDFWGAFEEEKGDAQLARKFFSEMSHRKPKQVAKILDGSALIDSLEVDVSEIPSILKYQILQSKLSLIDKESVTNTLNQLIRLGVEKGIWDLEEFTTIISIRQDEPVVKNNYDYKIAVDFHNLKLQIHQKSETEISDLILSLAMDSFILEKNQIIDTLNKMRHCEGLIFLSVGMMLELTSDGLNSTTKQPISPFTEVAFKKMSEDQHEKLIELCSNSRQEQKINSILKRSGLPINNLSDMIEYSAKAIFHVLPTFLQNLKSRSNNTHSLCNTTFNRFFGTELVEDIHKKSTVLKYPADDKVSYAGSKNWSKIRKLFSRNLKGTNGCEFNDEIQDHCNEMKKSIDSLFEKLEYSKKDELLKNEACYTFVRMLNERLLFSWGVNSLNITKDKKDKYSVKYAPTSAREDLDVIGKKLLQTLAYQELEKTSSYERSNLYFEVINQAESPRNGNSIRYALLSLENYLNKQKNLDQIDDFDELFDGVQSSKSSVNSNLISFDDFERIKTILISEISRTQNESLKLRIRMSFFVFLIGFRCGTRASEVLQLKLNDYRYSRFQDRSLVIIRESEGRGLKNPNATRRLSLVHYLSDAEIKELDIWSREVKKQVGDGDDQVYLFSLADDFKTPITRNSSIDNLMALIREVTGDKHLKFHHLRHSFASWLELSAFSAETNINFGKYFTGLPYTQNWLSLDKVQARKVKHLGYPQSSKIYLLWIAEHIGHADFLTTQKHYAHFIDIITMGLQQREWEKLTPKEISSTLELPINSLKNFARDEVHELSMKLFRKKNRSDQYSLYPLDIKYVKGHIEKTYDNSESFFQKSIWLEDYSFYKNYLIHKALIQSNNDLEQVSKRCFVSPEFAWKVMSIYQPSYDDEVNRNKAFIKQISASKLSNLIKHINTELGGQINVVGGVKSDQFRKTLDAFSEMFSTWRNQNRGDYPYEVLIKSRKPNSGKTLIEFIELLGLDFDLKLQASEERSYSEIKNMKVKWKKELSLSRKFKISHDILSKRKMKDKDPLKVIIKDEYGQSFTEFYFLMHYLYLNERWNVLEIDKS